MERILASLKSSTPAAQPSRDRREAKRAISYTCPACHDGAWVHPHRPDGSPDYAHVALCKCGQTANEVEARRQREAASGVDGFAADLFAEYEVTPPTQQAYSLALLLGSGDADFLWLSLLGDAGTGKTHLARAAARYCLDRNLSVRYVYVPALLRRLQRCMDPEPKETADSIMGGLERADLLVLDDLGAQYDSRAGWAWAQIEAIINARYQQVEAAEQRLMIVTSNRKLADFPVPVISRLRDRKYARIEVVAAPDYRTRRNRT